jgi:hypothetical protein
MKFKALRKKDTKEFIYFLVNENLKISLGTYISKLPNPMAITATMENVKEYYSQFTSNFDFNNIELIEFDMFESDVVGADIRNKLTPLKNLPAMLKILKKRKITKEQRKKIKELIEVEIIRCEKNVDYIANLL